MTHRYRLEVTDADHGQIRLRVSGEIDMAVAPQLLDSIICAALTCEKCAVIVDVGGVTFMDSTGLCALVDSHRRLTADGASLHVTNVTSNVAQLMELTGIDSYLCLAEPDTHPT